MSAGSTAQKVPARALSSTLAAAHPLRGRCFNQTSALCLIPPWQSLFREQLDKTGTESSVRCLLRVTASPCKWFRTCEHLAPGAKRIPRTAKSQARATQQEVQTRSSDSKAMHGEAPEDWNWVNWTHKFGEEFKGSWGDWRFFDLEGNVTKQFRGKRQGRCNPKRTVWVQRNFHDVELSPGRAFNEDEQMWEMGWQLEKATSSLPDGLMHTFMPSARVVTFDEHTRCLVQRDLRGKADSYGWETSYDDGEYHTSVTPTWRNGTFSSCGVISEKWESWPDTTPDPSTAAPLEAALGEVRLRSVRQITWTQAGGTGAMLIDDVSEPSAWPASAPGYHEIATPLGAWAVGPTTLPEVGASPGFWLSTAKRLRNGAIKRIVHVFSKELLIEKVLLEEYDAPT